MAENLTARGAYVAAEADGTRQVTIMASGSEVGIAMAAREALAADGINTAVVSVPCLELFAEQDAGARAAVLGECPRIAVEAAIRQPWDRLLRDGDAFVGMDGFGASGPAGDLYAHFGITADAVAARARAMIG